MGSGQLSIHFLLKYTLASVCSIWTKTSEVYLILNPLLPLDSQGAFYQNS